MPSKFQFANPLKQGSPGILYVLCISQPKRGSDLCQQPPKFLFAVYQSLSSQIHPVAAQQIEGEKARRVPTAKQQIFELWSTTSIEGTNFAVNDRSCVRQEIGDRFC